ncbi:MAG TPA: hypothetical protein DDW52_16150 [Planctomycetaceae bacterium]|nr:hypothetical protein [Planctomycetaceae bacterium]
MLRRTAQILLPRRPFSPRKSTHAGFTLLEVLVATAVTLLMMLALAKIFSDIGRSMKQGRAALELNGRLRDVTYRIQTVLNQATASPNSQPGSVSGRGYLEVHDGPTTDYTARTIGPLLSRFGDIDDTIMFTARAGDVWFTGKVPEFVLVGRPPTNVDANGPEGLGPNGLVDDFENLILVGAQHAEIAIFAQPTVAREKPGFPYQNPNRNAGFLTIEPAFYEDLDADSMPDRYRLHMRTLIIRPDLNDPLNPAFPPDGLLPGDITNGLFCAKREIVDGIPLPSPLCDMFRIHNICDLSVRREFDGNGGTADRVAANSLQDLENPANRFAHVQLPIPGTGSTSLPVMALTPSLPVHASDPLRIDFTVAGPYSATNRPYSGTGIMGGGFLHPAYALQGARAGEDVLGTDVLAFDVRGYDPGAPLLSSPGADTAWGVRGEDDDQNGTVNDASEFGWAGSDDLVLSPSDPGYGAYLMNLVANNTAPDAVTTATGEYVDFAWARKLAGHGTTLAPTMNLWSPLSGMSFGAFTNTTSPALQRLTTTPMLWSGKELIGNQGRLLFQPSYDTWTDLYERDGRLQAQLGGNSRGHVMINGQAFLYGNAANDIPNAVPNWRRTNIDPAFDGLDNDNSSGADDQQEFETRPPFDSPLRGLKILVRMEAPGAREVRELPVSVEFVTQ